MEEREHPGTLLEVPFTADSCQNTGHLMTYWNSFQLQKKSWGADSEPWGCCGMMECGGFALFITEISFSWSMFSLPPKQVWNMASWVLLWIPSPPRDALSCSLFIFYFTKKNMIIVLISELGRYHLTLIFLIFKEFCLY